MEKTKNVITENIEKKSSFICKNDRKRLMEGTFKA